MNKFLTLILVLIAGIAVVASAYVLSKSKLGGKAKASSERISVIGLITKLNPCIKETICYKLTSTQDGQIYFINTKEFAWISVDNDALEKRVNLSAEVTGLYIQGKTSYLVPTEVR